MPKRDEFQKELPLLIKQLAGDGARVAEAELSLARAEAAIIARRYVIGMAVGTCGIATAITALVILAQAFAIALAPFMTNPAYAYFSIGLVMLAITIILSLISAHLFARKHEPIGTILTWVMGHGDVE
jgi:Putative Actinobacterial Holin-X, holin superfamily III